MVLTFEKPRIYVRAENEIPRERKLRIKFLPLLEAHIGTGGRFMIFFAVSEGFF